MQGLCLPLSWDWSKGQRQGCINLDCSTVPQIPSLDLWTNILGCLPSTPRLNRDQAYLTRSPGDNRNLRIPKGKKVLSSLPRFSPKESQIFNFWADMHRLGCRTHEPEWWVMRKEYPLCFLLGLEILFGETFFPLETYLRVYSSSSLYFALLIFLAPLLVVIV